MSWRRGGRWTKSCGVIRALANGQMKKCSRNRPVAQDDGSTPAGRAKEVAHHDLCAKVVNVCHPERPTSGTVRESKGDLRNKKPLTWRLPGLTISAVATFHCTPGVRQICLRALRSMMLALSRVTPPPDVRSNWYGVKNFKTSETQ